MRTIKHCVQAGSYRNQYDTKLPRLNILRTPERTIRYLLSTNYYLCLRNQKPYLTLPCHAMSCHTIPCHVMSYHTIPYHTIPYHTTPYHTIPYHTIPYHTTPYHIIPYHTIPYHTIPYHTIPYHTIPYHTGIISDYHQYDTPSKQPPTPHLRVRTELPLERTRGQRSKRLGQAPNEHTSPHLPCEAISRGPADLTLSSHLCRVTKPPTTPPASWQPPSYSTTVPPAKPTANSSPPVLRPTGIPSEVKGAVLTAAPPRAMEGNLRPPCHRRRRRNWL